MNFLFDLPPSMEEAAIASEYAVRVLGRRLQSGEQGACL